MTLKTTAWIKVRFSPARAFFALELRAGMTIAAMITESRMNFLNVLRFQ